MDTTTKTREAEMDRNPFDTLRENPFEDGAPTPAATIEEEPMFTIIDEHTNESVKVRSEAVVELLSGDDAQWNKTNEQLEAEAEPITTEGDPVLFDTELEAADWAAAHELDPKRFAIVAVEDVLQGDES
jgi:hypothetical protein